MPKYCLTTKKNTVNNIIVLLKSDFIRPGNILEILKLEINILKQ